MSKTPNYTARRGTPHAQIMIIGFTMLGLGRSVYRLTAGDWKLSSLGADFVGPASACQWVGKTRQGLRRVSVLHSTGSVADLQGDLTVPWSGSRSGFGRQRSFGGRSRAAGKNGGRSRSSSRSARLPGNSRSARHGVVAYSIYNSRGKRIYVGSTNSPGRRASQHARDGKLPHGGELVVESRPMSREAAQQLEARKIQGYRRRTGRLPRHNRTSDGQYHHRRRGPVGADASNKERRPHT